MKITRLSPQKRRSKRVSVFLDGRYGFSLHQDTVDRLGLCEGMEVNGTEIDRVVHEEELRRAKEYAALLLSYRARTEHELLKRLLKKGFSPETTTEAVERLKQLRLVDDARFARDYVADRVKIGRRGKHAAHLELIKLGVSKENTRQAIDRAPDEFESARELVAKHSPRYARLDPAARRRRLFALLNRRGFSYDTIRQALSLDESD